jgi:hypothetical protein
VQSFHLRDVRRLCRIAGWIGTIVIFILSVVPGDARPHSGVAPGQFEHLFAYMLTAGALALGYSGKASRLLVCALLVGLAAALEVAQIWIPGRNAEVIGFSGSALGAALGCAAAAVLDLTVGGRWTSAVRRRPGPPPALTPRGQPPH